MKNLNILIGAKKLIIGPSSSIRRMNRIFKPEYNSNKLMLYAAPMATLKDGRTFNRAMEHEIVYL